jgi:hypothetical protein
MLNLKDYVNLQTFNAWKKAHRTFSPAGYLLKTAEIKYIQLRPRRQSWNCDGLHSKKNLEAPKGLNTALGEIFRRADGVPNLGSLYADHFTKNLARQKKKTIPVKNKKKHGSWKRKTKKNYLFGLV